ncbi:MAG: hypothetical protein HYS53_00755 [Candidatus Aenigmarchaeota archaeon]|nr:hypothetical protein [Candidatus Aenigmarchaeota archaeon]
MQQLVTRPTSSAYPLIGTAYKSRANTIDYSPGLTKAGKNYPSGQRMSTAAEELAIQLGLERAGKDSRRADVFDDLFGRNHSNWRASQWTDTDLRVPKGRDPDKYETDGQGRKYWVRTAVVGDEEFGEVLVPEGYMRVVVEWDEVFGIPRVTEDIDFPHKPYTTHFWFNPTPFKDGRSVHQDIAVGRRGGWNRVAGEKCLGVDADGGRWNTSLHAGFRPVRGLLPEINQTN